MSRGKSINLFLIDGDVSGRVKCTIANWNGVSFKIPRTSLELCKDRFELKQTGVYLLFGKDESTDNSVVYVGQAGVRKNGEGLLNRLQEHNRNPKKDYWNEAIAITTTNDVLGPTEISYLEHRLCQLAIEAGRYDVKNGNDPTPGNPSEEKQSELEDFIDFVRIMVGTLGHKVFEPLIAKNSNSSLADSDELYCKRSGANAVGVRTADGFVVKKGSIIVENVTNSCPERVINLRSKYKEFIVNQELQVDILFTTPSGASSFVCGSSTNGFAEWKSVDGISLKDIEETQ